MSLIARIAGVFVVGMSAWCLTCSPVAGQTRADSVTVPDTVATSSPVTVPDTVRPAPPARRTSPPSPASDDLDAIGRVLVAPLSEGQAVSRPYRQEPSVYRSAPALRYNRVEGPVVGFQRGPMTWAQDRWLHSYGQVGASIGLERPRLTGGLEVRFVQPSPEASYGLKAGIRGDYTTATQDAWKRSWTANSTSMLLRGDDLFAYYEVRGGTGYLVQRLSKHLRVTTGVRWEEHTALPVTTRWSLLGDAAVEPNAPVEDAEIRVAMLTVEGGRLLKRSEHRSTGIIARVHAEWGSSWGAPDPYDRLIVDVQSFQPIAPEVNLNLRGRAAVASAAAPEQMRFRIDGVSGLRTFTPPGQTSDRMLLGGVQLVHYDAPLLPFPRGVFDPVHVSAFVDAGRTRSDRFGFAGLGASVFGRLVSVEVAWPLHREGFPQWTLKVDPLR